MDKKLKYFFIILFLVSFVLPAIGQEITQWTLDSCMEYAKVHNYSVQKSVLDERVAKMRWENAAQYELIFKIKILDYYSGND